MASTPVRIEGLSKRFGDIVALDSVSGEPVSGAKVRCFL